MFYATHRLGGRLLGRLSGLAAADLFDARRVRLARAQAVVTDLTICTAQRGPMMDKLGSASLAEIAADPQLLDFARAVGRAGLCRQLRALPRRRRRRRQGLSQSQRRRLAVGRQARRHRARPSATASAPATTRPTRATCRPSAATHAEAERDFGGRRLCPLALRAADRRRQPISRRQESLRRQLRGLSRRRRQGQSRARRAESDRHDLALRVRQGDHRERH